MYILNEILRYIHSWNRWAILVLLVIVLAKAWQGWKQNKPFTPADNKNAGILIGLFHLQLLLGIILYAIIYIPYWQGMGMGLMKEAPVRFYAVEHLITMILAVALAQMARIAAKKAKADVIKHKKTFILNFLAMVVIGLSLIPGLMRGFMPWFRLPF